MEELSALKTEKTSRQEAAEAESLSNSGGAVVPTTMTKPSSLGSNSTNFIKSFYTSSNESSKAESKSGDSARPAEEVHPHSDLFQSSYSPSTKKPKKKKRDPDRAPRPPNAWILYRAQKNSELVEQQSEIESKGYGGARLQQSEVSRMISSMWQSESQETRDRFGELAKRLKAEHKIMYPNYEYRPRLVTTASENELTTLNSTKGEDPKRPNRSNSSGETFGRPRGSSHGNIGREIESSDDTNSVSPVSPQGSFQALPGMGIGINESSFDGLPTGSQEFGHQRQSSRPRASTDIRSPQQFSSPPFGAYGTSEPMRSSSNSQLSSSSRERQTSQGRDLVRKDREEEDEAGFVRSRRMVKPSAFLPLSYQVPALTSLSLQSPREESAPSSAFPVWNGEAYAQNSMSPSSNFAHRIEAPRSAPASSTGLNYSSFSLAVDSIDRGLPGSMVSYEFTPPDAQQYVQRFPQSRDSLYFSGGQEDPEWNSAVGKAQRELDPEWNETFWTQAGRYNGEVTRSPQEVVQWKGILEPSESQIDVGINAGQPQGQMVPSQNDGALISPRPFGNYNLPSDPRAFSKDEYWSRSLVNSPSGASSLGLLDVNASSSISQGYQEESHTSSSSRGLSIDYERQGDTPSASLRLNSGQLGGEEEIEPHGSYTPSELFKILQLNQSKSPEQH